MAAYFLVSVRRRTDGISIHDPWWAVGLLRRDILLSGYGGRYATSYTTGAFRLTIPGLRFAVPDSLWGICKISGGTTVVPYGKPWDGIAALRGSRCDGFRASRTLTNGTIAVAVSVGDFAWFGLLR